MKVSKYLIFKTVIQLFLFRKSYYLYKSKNSNKFEVRLRRLRYTASAAVAVYASYLYKNKKKNKLSDDFHKRAKRDTEQYKELIELLDDPVFSYMPYYY